MKKLIVFGIAICTTVLSVSQPARADWKLLANDTAGNTFYYDEYYTHPIRSHSNVFITRFMVPNHTPKYVMFACVTTGFAQSDNENSGFSCMCK